MGGRGATSATTKATGPTRGIDSDVAEVLGSIGHSIGNLPGKPTGVGKRANEVYYALAYDDAPGRFSAKTAGQVREIAEYNLGRAAKRALMNVTTDAQLSMFASPSARADAQASSAKAWDEWDEAKRTYRRIVSAVG